MTYREMIDERNDEIMCDVRNRQTEAWKIIERFQGDPEGFRQWEESNLARLGFRLDPIGNDGAARLMRITK